MPLLVTTLVVIEVAIVTLICVIELLCTFTIEALAALSQIEKFLLVLVTGKAVLVALSAVVLVIVPPYYRRQR